MTVEAGGWGRQGGPATAPIVCVAIPVFNGSDFIAGAVESVLSQDYPNVRVLVADNASTDGTRDILASITDERLRCILHNEHVPVEASYARALGASCGEYVMVLSADNELLPGAITCLIAALGDHRDCGLAYGRTVVEVEDGYDRHGGSAITPPRRGVVADFEAAVLADGFNLPLDATLFRRDLPGLHIDPTAGSALDFDLMLRLGRHGVAGVGIIEPVALIRQHGRAVSDRRERVWSDTLETLQRHRERSRHRHRYASRIRRVLLWLTLHLVERGQAEVARGYLSRNREQAGKAWCAALEALIAVPALTRPVWVARRLLGHYARWIRR